LPVFRQSSNFGTIFTHILFAKGGAKVRGLIFHSKYLFLAIHAKGGESISPKQKDRTTTLILKRVFSNWYLIVFKRGRK
jgi:hypothetical protein